MKLQYSTSGLIITLLSENFFALVCCLLKICPAGICSYNIAKYCFGFCTKLILEFAGLGEETNVSLVLFCKLIKMKNG